MKLQIIDKKYKIMYYKKIYCKSYWRKIQNYTSLNYLLLAIEHLELWLLWFNQRKGRDEHYSCNNCTQNTYKKDPDVSAIKKKKEKEKDRISIESHSALINLQPKYILKRKTISFHYKHLWTSIKSQLSYCAQDQRRMHPVCEIQ